MQIDTHVLLVLLGNREELVRTAHTFLIEHRMPIAEIWFAAQAPDRLHLADELFASPYGAFAKFCRTHNLEPDTIDFGPEKIIALPPAGNSGFEPVFDLVQRKSQIPTCALHCCLADGHRHDAANLALGLQPLLRRQDRFYNLQRPEKGRAAKPQPEAATLHPINLNAAVLEPMTDAEASQHFLPLHLDSATRTVKIGDQICITLPGFQYNLYKYFVLKSYNRPDSIETDDYLNYFVLGGKSFTERERQHLAQLLKKDAAILEWPRLQQEISKIRRELARYQPELPNFEYYTISAVGTWGNNHYGIKLDKRFIHFES